MLREIKPDPFFLIRHAQAQDGIYDLQQKVGHDKRINDRAYGRFHLDEKLAWISVEEPIGAARIDRLGGPKSGRDRL